MTDHTDHPERCPICGNRMYSDLCESCHYDDYEGRMEEMTDSFNDIMALEKEKKANEPFDDSYFLQTSFDERI